MFTLCGPCEVRHSPRMGTAFSSELGAPSWNQILEDSSALSRAFSLPSTPLQSAPRPHFSGHSVSSSASPTRWGAFGSRERVERGALLLLTLTHLGGRTVSGQQDADRSKVSHREGGTEERRLARAPSSPSDCQGHRTLAMSDPSDSRPHYVRNCS